MQMDRIDKYLYHLGLFDQLWYNEHPHYKMSVYFLLIALTFLVCAQTSGRVHYETPDMTQWEIKSLCYILMAGATLAAGLMFTLGGQ